MLKQKIVMFCCVVLLNFLSANSIGVDISGTITDTAGHPVSGAVVRLTTLGVADTTSSDGAYSIAGDFGTGTGSFNAINFNRFLKPELCNGQIRFSIQNSSRVSLSLYDFKGRMILCAVNGTLGPGDYSINLLNQAVHNLPNAIYLSILNINGQKYVYKLSSVTLKQNSLRRTQSISKISAPIAMSFKKESAVVVDTLIAEMINPVTTKQSERIVVPVLSYNGEIDFDFYKDTDGDGLTDYREIYVFGTSMVLKDTDGDGWDDAYEAELFDAQVPESFNPLVADIPALEIILVNSPTVHFNYTTNSETAKEMAIVSSAAVSSNNSWGNTNSQSFATELGLTLDTKVSGTIKVKGAELAGSVAAGVSTSSSRQYGIEVSVSQSTENEVSYSNALNTSNMQGSEITGGTITLALKFHNPSPISFTLDNISLSVYYLDHTKPGYLSTIASNLFCPLAQSIVVGARGTTNEFVFTNENLNIDEVQGLMTRASQFFTEIAGYSLSNTSVNGDAGDFVGSATTISAQTAKTSVDFGPYKGKMTRTWNVATLCKYNKFEQKNMSVSLYDILNYTKIRFRSSTSSGGYLISIDSTENSPSTRSYWFATVKREASLVAYPVSDPQFDLSAISVTKGDDIRFIYSSDKDGDGLPERVEFMLGCSDTKIDSDGDTLADSSEVFGFKQGGVTYKTDPSRMDTDGDGLGDNSDPNPLERIRLTGTNLSRVAILTSDSMTICNMQAERGAVNCKVNVTESAEFIRLVITAGQIVGDISVVNLRNLTDTLHFTGGFQRNDQLVDTLEIPVFPGSNTFNVRVTSDNNANYEMYYVNTVYGRLPQLKTWLLTSAALPADASYRVILDSLEHRNNSVTNVLIGHILSTSTSSPVQAHTELAYKVLAGDQVIIGQHTVKVDSVITVTGGALSAGRQVTVSGLAHSTFFNIIAQPFGPISGTTRFLYRNAETVKSITSQ